MNLKRLLFTLFIFSPILLNAQSEGHENHYGKIEPIETENFEVEFSDAHSQLGFVFVKLHIVNKTSDYLMFKPHMISFKLNGKVYHPGEEGDVIMISPNEDEKEKLKVEAQGDENMHVEALSMEIKGFYKVPSEGEVQKAEPFKLPASKNTFKVGDGTYECSLAGDVTQETDETVADFECTYQGDKIGIVDRRKVSIKTEEGDEFANKKKKGLFGKIAGKEARKTLQKGESAKVKTHFEIPAKVVDMQFATLHIQWNDAFQESTPEELDPHSRKLELDEKKTAEMN